MNVQEYINNYSEEEQIIMNQLRSLILSCGVEEKISWGTPTYYYHGYLLQFGMCKNHLGFYVTPTTIHHFKDRLKDYKTNSKNTIHLPKNKKLDEALILDIIHYRMNENL